MKQDHLRNTVLTARATPIHMAAIPRETHRIGREKGVTLIELMVGITLGLLVVAVAGSALMTSRGISGTVSDATSLQEQAAYAFRVIGQQVRQAGSLELNLNPSIVMSSASDDNAYMVPVAFDAPDPTGVLPQFSRADSTVTGDTTPSFTVGYQNYTETTLADATVPAALLRDCLGQNKVTSGVPDNPVLSSTFKRKTATNELVCTGTGGSGGEQAIIGNVTDMQVRYIQQVPNTTTLQYLSNPSAVTSWSNVYAVEVCLELTGSEAIPDAGTKYTNCSGTLTAYGSRLKMVFRNVYEIRSQGQT